MVHSLHSIDINILPWLVPSFTYVSRGPPEERKKVDLSRAVSGHTTADHSSRAKYDGWGRYRGVALTDGRTIPSESDRRPSITLCIKSTVTIRYYVRGKTSITCRMAIPVWLY